MSDVTHLGTAAPAYSQNPTQTAAASADTTFKWGNDGTLPVEHISIQNNTGANILYSFDVATTAAGAAVYVLASGLPPVVWDRHCLILHLQSAAQQPINDGSTAGIVIEGFQ